MDKEQIKPLIEKYLNGTASDEESVLVETWYNTYQEDAHPELSEGMIVSAVDRVEERLGARGRKVRLWSRVAVAAAAVAAIVLGIYFFNAPVADRHAEFISASQDIAPGKNGATITLANGRVIQLSDSKNGVVIGNEVSYSDGSDVRYSSGSRSSGSLKGSQRSTGPVGVRSLSPSELQGVDGKAQILTAATARGQMYQFTLPDGTKVWLNADSKLEFPSSFVTRKTRNVKLSGEGYFEVAKDKAHAFIVETDKQEVEVLGTHFNINSYDDEASTRTTLLEGSVNVNGTILKPKQQAVTRAGTIKVRETNIEEAVAWKDGLFKFDNTDLQSIMKQIGRWYDLDVVYEGTASSRAFSGLIRRDVKLSQILKVLETGGIKFRIEEPLKTGGAKRIVVMQ
jgi:ferric-dicitrate binding protein FerR (iron transport regulator)